MSEETPEQKIDQLRVLADLIRQEFDLASSFHEAWKPAAFDTALHQRLGTSRATRSFNVIQLALRREMLLALARIWDTNSKSIRMGKVRETLKNKLVIRTITTKAASRLGWLSELENLIPDVQGKADQAISIINKYIDGSGKDTLEKLLSLRHQRLAHRQADETAHPLIVPNNQEIEDFYQDNAKLVNILLSLAQGLHYSPLETAEVHRRCAEYFWAGVRGERTEGHPNFRPMPGQA